MNHVHACPECYQLAPCSEDCDPVWIDGVERHPFAICDDCRDGNPPTATQILSGRPDAREAGW